MELGMRSNCTAGFVCLVGLWLVASPAAALQFEQVAISPTEVIVSGRGPIVKGDSGRLEQALAAVPPALQVSALAFDSPGGNVVEGELLAQLIRTRKLAVVIPANSKCVSACFLLLAASPRRLAAVDALVGVHSASEGSEETQAALAGTARMAKAAAAFGIPPALIGKMVQTSPGRVEWLTQADLGSMNVVVFDDDTPTAVHRTNTIGARQIDRVLPPLPKAATPVDFAAGLEDRRDWDVWLASLRGSFRDGAAFAQAQPSPQQPGSCSGADTVNRGDFTSGCEAAWRRLTPVNIKLRSNADYTAGWNSASQPVLSDEPVEAEYQGAFFCGRQVARFALQVFSQTDEPKRRAMFSFGPQPTSPDVPHGAFIVEGSIGLQGGPMSLLPLKWVSQPAGYNWVGLNGSSGDGGKTFAGRITDNNGCTIFTLKRIDDATAAR
jgi:hypothetical protein